MRHRKKGKKLGVNPSHRKSMLMNLANNLIELKTICEYKNCARKATMICRLDAEGNVITKGNQIDIGGDQYKVFCRKHYRKLTELI